MLWDNLQILLLDDEENSLILSRQTIAYYVPEENIRSAFTVEEAMKILKETPIQLAFLDIELSHSNGFEFSEYIHRNYPQTEVVILTGHVDLGAKSYEYEPLDFLVKPVDVLRVERTFRRYEEHQKRNAPQPRIMVESGSGFTMVDPGEIRYITKERSAVLIYFEAGQPIRVNYSLDHLEEMLSQFGYFRIHQSFLVPAARIMRVHASAFGNSFEAILDDGSKIPVSRSKFAKLKEYLRAQSFHLM